jgi:hypothetical protein
MNDSNAPQGQDNSTKQSNESENSGTLRDVPPFIPEIPPETRKPSDNPPKSPAWWKRLNWSIIIELCVLAVGIKVACIYSGQLKEMIATNKTSHDALVASQRPWLVNDGKPILTVDKIGDDWIGGSFTFTVKNFGPSPALNIGQGIHFFVRTPHETDDVFEEARKDACQWADTDAFIAGTSIFPNQAHTYGPQGAFRVPGITPAYSNSMILVAGCIAYRDQFDIHHTTHHTTFCLMGSAKDKPMPLYLCGHDEIAN